MALTYRQKLTVISLLLYWPGVFILAHIPIPQLVIRAHICDKYIHSLAYLVLVFLLWFAISPNSKVNWRKATVWWVVFVVVWYGVFDEWLQGYVGRNPDVIDFFADLAGTLAGLILLSIFAFWPASLIVAGIIIFLLTNLTQVNPAELMPATNAAFHFFAYGFFAVLWIQYMNRFLPIKAPQVKWLIVASVLPTGLLLVVKLFSVISGRDFAATDIIIATGSIATVVGTIFLTALFRRRFARRLSADDTHDY